MAQLKAGSTVGGTAIAVDSPAVVPTANITITGTKQFGSYVVASASGLRYSLDSVVANLTSFQSGGYFVPGPGTLATIDKFPFASSAPFTATSAGSLSVARSSTMGQSSSTHGYASGGNATPGYSAVVDRFPFSTPFTTATNIGSLSAARSSGIGAQSSIEGFTVGSETVGNSDKFPFSTPFTTATSIGTLNPIQSYASGNSSTIRGYVTGGGPGTVTTFPFTVAPVSFTSVGSLSQTRRGTAGHSSTTEGYAAGGTTVSPTPVAATTIDKFPFAAPFVSATSVGALSQARAYTAGTSSATRGYTSGGSPPGYLQTIDYYPFTAPFTTATGGALLSQARNNISGQQY